MKEAIITVTGKQAQPDGAGEDTIELVTEGSYEYCEGDIRISYPESEMTGFAGCTTLFSIKPGLIVMKRIGSECGDMIFEPGKHHRYLYSTEVGDLMLGVNTISCRSSLTEQGGKIEISYLLDFDDKAFSRNAFIITVKTHVEDAE